jgi:hypothetical protein
MSPGPHDRACSFRGSGQIEQVRPLGVIELEGTGDGIQHAGRGSGEGASFEFRVVLDAHAGQRGDLAPA